MAMRMMPAMMGMVQTAVITISGMMGKKQRKIAIAMREMVRVTPAKKLFEQKLFSSKGLLPSSTGGVACIRHSP